MMYIRAPNHYRLLQKAHSDSCILLEYIAEVPSATHR